MLLTPGQDSFLPGLMPTAFEPCVACCRIDNCNPPPT